ncbi:hypothetical protein LTR53_010460 [Teratosphaeriaceae sp. CCFEE 6253]|nr:hypothetical protein LTR53_010460 [Teratosphaeriaceae sp. CCFEE 6253]
MPVQPLTLMGDGDLDLEAAGYGAFASFDGVWVNASSSTRMQDSIESPLDTRPGLDAFFAESSSISGSVYSRHHSDPFVDGTSSPPDSLMVAPLFTDFSNPYPDYDTVRTFAQSGEGRVRVVKQLRTGELLVVKTVRMQRRANGPGYSILNEAAMLTRHLGRHPNIIQCLDFDNEQPPFCHMLLEFCSGGDLYDFCKHWKGLKLARGSHVPPMFLLHYLSSMINALVYLHKGSSTRQPIIHRDIKSPNIFLRWSGNAPYGLPDIVLSDFGFACFKSESSGWAGTPGYLPPPIENLRAMSKHDPSAYNAALSTYKMTAACDVYTFGATLYELIFLQGFDNARHSYSLADIADEFKGSPYANRRGCKWTSLHSVLKRSLAEEPGERETASGLESILPEIDRMLTAIGEAGERMPPDSWPNGNPFETVQSVAGAQSSSFVEDVDSISDMHSPIPASSGSDRTPSEGADAVCQTVSAPQVIAGALRLLPCEMSM